MLVTIIIVSKSKYKIRDIKKLVSLFLYVTRNKILSDFPDL